MKKWLVIVPVAAAAAGAALVLGKSKSGAATEKTAKPAKAPKMTNAVVAKKDGFTIKNPRTGEYTFTSGYRDAKEITVSVGYDADKHSFAVVSEEFVADTGDSHVAVIYADDFAMQIEYAPYYHGEGFTELEKSVEEHYKNFGHVSFKGAKGICYTNGGSYCMAFPAADSADDYILVTVVLMGDDNEDERIKLRTNPEMLAIMDTLVIG